MPFLLLWKRLYFILGDFSMQVFSESRIKVVEVELSFS